MNSVLQRMIDLSARPLESLAGREREFVDLTYVLSRTLPGSAHPPSGVGVGGRTFLGMLAASRELSQFLQVDAVTLLSWIEDLNRKPSHELEVRSSWKARTGADLPPGRWPLGTLNTALYVFVRAFRPKVIVETGVEYGFSTSFLLRGLEDNGVGKMISIDLPTIDPRGRINADGRRDPAHVDAVGSTGRSIPDRLRPRWQYVAGPSNPTLVEVLQQVGGIDFFFHDSDHSRQNMLWEFNTVWPQINSGGALLADDVDWGTAFDEFRPRGEAGRFRWWGQTGARGIISKG